MTATSVAPRSQRASRARGAPPTPPCHLSQPSQRSHYQGWLQHRVTQQRYKVYGLFLAVPLIMVRGLASKTISIHDGSGSEVRAPSLDLAIVEHSTCIAPAHPAARGAAARLLLSRG